MDQFIGKPFQEEERKGGKGPLWFGKTLTYVSMQLWFQEETRLAEITAFMHEVYLSIVEI